MIRKVGLLLILLLILGNIFAIRNWKLYTNTTRMYDALQVGNEIYLATWGGLLVYNQELQEYTKEYQTNDGLADYDVTCLEYMDYSDEILIGTRSGGLSRMKDGEFKIALNEDLGLQSDRVNAIATRGNRIFVGTNHGLSVFMQNEGFPYPNLVDNYGDNNGMDDENIIDLALTDNGYLVLATQSAITTVHIDSLYLENSWDNKYIQNQFCQSVTTFDNKVVAGISSGLFIKENITDENWDFFADAQTFASNQIKSVHLVSKNELWLSYGIWNEEFFLILNNDEQNIACSRYDLANMNIEHFYAEQFNTNMIYKIDQLGNQIALMSWGEGFFLQEQDDFIKIKPNSISSNVITEMDVDQDSKLWICDGTNSGAQAAFGMKGVSSFDGQNWQTLNVDNSEILSNNIFCLEVGADNKKFFGSWSSDDSLLGWQRGLSVLNDNNWSLFANNGIGSGTISDVELAPNGDIYVGSAAFGVSVLDQDLNIIHDFSVPSFTTQKIYEMKFFDDKLFLGTYRDGVAIWDSNELPNGENSEHWITTNAEGISGMTTFSSAARDDELYFVGDSGMYLFKNGDWYKFDISIKIQKWDNGWQVHERYIVDQERLFGSEYTTPSAVFVDHYGRVWIGSTSKGISIYNPDYDNYKNEFINYSTENSPLISNTINAFAYDPVSGRLFIGTDKGLNSVEIGRTIKIDNDLQKVVAYPNPFHPEEGEVVRIENLPEGTMPKGQNYCYIYDMNGDLVYKMEEDKYFQFSWDGRNKYGKKCGSGIYYYVVSTAIGETARGTIVLIR